jgi:hypothetical protein
MSEDDLSRVVRDAALCCCYCSVQPSLNHRVPPSALIQPSSSSLAGVLAPRRRSQFRVDASLIVWCPSITLCTDRPHLRLQLRVVVRLQPRRRVATQVQRLRVCAAVAAAARERARPRSVRLLRGHEGHFAAAVVQAHVAVRV